MPDAESVEQLPVTEISMIAEDPRTTSWNSAQQALTEADSYWLTTVRPDGRPHTTRVLAVWTDSALHFCTSPRSRKGKNLDQNEECTIAATSRDIDLIVEGRADRVMSEMMLQRVAAAYANKYGWHVTVRDNAFQDTEGAPTAGPPPYLVYRVNPRVAFSFGADGEEFSPTRWTF